MFSDERRRKPRRGGEWSGWKEKVLSLLFPHAKPERKPKPYPCRQQNLADPQASEAFQLEFASLKPSRKVTCWMSRLHPLSLLALKKAPKNTNSQGEGDKTRKNLPTDLTNRGSVAGNGTRRINQYANRLMIRFASDFERSANDLITRRFTFISKTHREIQFPAVDPANTRRPSNSTDFLC